MSAAWERVHDRYRVSRVVLEEVGRSGRADAVSAWADEIEAAFGDLDAFLQHVQRRWYTALAARVDAVLEQDVADRQAAVRAAWSELAGVDPATRVVLDAYAGHPALQHGERAHTRLLGAALASPPQPRVIARQRRWVIQRCPLRSWLRALPTR